MQLVASDYACMQQVVDSLDST